MPRKCIICGQPAQFCVKGSSECYCAGCAVEQFGDVSYLVAVEEAARALHHVVNDQMDEISRGEQ